jgi:hypothetical protein
MTVKGKGIPRQAEVAQGVPGRLRPRIFSNFGTTRVVGRQPNAPDAFTPGTPFQRLSRPQDIWFCRKEPRKKSQVTPPGIDPGTVRLVAQRLNHYATPVPCTVDWVRADCNPAVRSVQMFTESEDTRCCVNTIFPPEDGHVNARNMSKIIM